MSDILQIFAPYLSFISFLVTLTLNIVLIYHKSNWYILIFANLLLTITMNMIGLGTYDFLTQFFTSIFDLLTDLFSYLIDMIINLFNIMIDAIGDLLESIIDAINPF